MTSTNRSMRLFVLGATGGIGRQLVDQALERHHQVTAFLRSPQKLGGARDGLTVIRGDVRDTDAISAAIAGHDAVLSTLGPPGPARNTITSDGARTTVAAMQTAGVRRLIIVGVAALFPDIGVFGRLLRNTLLRNVADDSAEMERIVKASGLDWTIVRPPRLTNGPRRERYGLAVDHLPKGAGANAIISRADVAHFMLNELESPAHIRQVVGVAYTKMP
ncbi:NAD(P)-dependent oxidoreductase [Occallatibacter riparius]|uniref:SDR family oxidoreductase n=1 Tax=Occallatibacter riparius TaxID=1002689 RepID=A0A9J7BT22_9BACT|nr:SDR family oxidoreductase [Occallatibacter riparius]UWZ84165.1 SDR family oxidoreductase [Occallatibacter riparius]